MIEQLPLPQALRNGVAPTAPLKMRYLLARGEIPLNPRDRLGVLACLLQDPSEMVREAAVAGLRGMDGEILSRLVAERDLHPLLLDAMALYHAEALGLVLAILGHPNVGAATLSRYVASTLPEIVDVLSHNQRALSQCPDVARALLENPLLEGGVRGRIESLFGGAPEAEEPLPDPTGMPTPEEIEKIVLPDDVPEELLVEGREIADAKNVFALIQKLSIAEKIKLATLGTKGARKLLARDSNRLVVIAVIRSPKIREDEVAAMAQDKTMPDDVILYILQRKDWIKNYQIRLGICQNPKTPMPRALRLLETLADRDLRALSKSRNVPAVISQAALRIISRKLAAR